MDRAESKWDRAIKIFAIVIAVFGLSVFILFLLRLSSEYSISPNLRIALDKTGQSGDFIGGVVGSLWSFSGMLLFYLSLRLQRKELDAQILEMRSQRLEFQSNRINKVVYNQISQLINAVKEIEFYNKKGLPGIMLYIPVPLTP